MSDESDSWRQGAFPRELIRVEIEKLSPEKLLKIGQVVAGVVGPLRSREFIVEAMKRCLNGEYPWDPSDDFADHLIYVMVTIRASELEDRDPEILARLEQEVTRDERLSNVLRAVRAGLQLEEYYEISPEEYRAALGTISHILLTLRGDNVG